MKEYMHSAIDFLTTFFVENYITTKLLSDIVNKRGNASFLRTLGLPEDFNLPFFQDTTALSQCYVIKPNKDEKYSVSFMGKSCNEHVISNGDYITFKNAETGITIKVLFIDASTIRVGYKKFKLQKNSIVSIGRTPTNDISFNLNDFISREKHVAINVDEKGKAYVKDLKRSTGIYVNGKLTQFQELYLFDEIFVMGLSIVYLGQSIAVRNFLMTSSLHSIESFPAKDLHIEESKPYFIRTPRILKSLDRDEIEIDAPPNPPTMDDTPVILILGPSLTMSLVMLASLSVSISHAINGGDKTTLIMSSVMAIGMLLGAIMWPMLLHRYQRKNIIKAEKHRKERYLLYMTEIEQKLINKTDRAVRLLKEQLNPSPDFLYSLLETEIGKLRLWERSFTDEDFLNVRVGIGNYPFDVKIKIPRKGFQLYEDELIDLPSKLVERYSLLEQVPLTIDIKAHSTIGFIGKQDHIYSILHEIILNIIALHPYDEVKLMFVIPPQKLNQFDIYKNLPHVWSNDRRVRYFATNQEEVHYIFNNVDEVLQNREDFSTISPISDTNKLPVPHYVLVILDSTLIEREALLRYINSSQKTLGITTFFVYGDIMKLPKFCETIIHSDEVRTGYYTKNENENRFVQFTFDKMNQMHLRDFSMSLSRLKLSRDLRSLGIPDRISFMQMYKAGNLQELSIQERWECNNSAKSLAAPIGIMAGGEIFYLDIHETYHGCHGLVAGTTGSGKSEFLQSFVLSLALNYSPNEIAFVLVDFKGGDMARPFIAKPSAPALPHLSSTISNLSGNILYRALFSFEAEINFRQRLFNESAATLGIDKLDINSYHKYFKAGKLQTPLPHLIIIIDEFAQLKTQKPEFLTQLINVAQVGRSLGIHLILATQKPSGVVDPQIWSNSRFKICLKVTDKQDSIDMINTPDSAMIKNPGRLFVQIGYNEIYECVQSGYSGAEYVPTKTYMPEDEITVQMTDHTANPIHSARLDMSIGRTDKTQLEAIVSEIVKLGVKKNCVAKPLWVELLPKKILLDILPKQKKSLCTVTIGLVDYVRMQAQKPLTFDLTRTGHIGLYGASGTGKTTFLQTLVHSLVCYYNYTPDELNIYAIDCGGRSLSYLETLPHTGGVAYADNEEKISNLASILYDIINDRKKLFAANNCGNYIEFRTSNDNLLPVILVLIDNFSSFHEKFYNLSERFFEIVSLGRTFGIYFIITGNTRNSIYYKVTEHISTYFVYKMNDPSNYFDILNVRPFFVPEDINGRGITVIKKEVVEFQTALAFDSENEADRIALICAKYELINSTWNGTRPISITSTLDENDSYDENITISDISHDSSPDAISNIRENLIVGKSKTGILEYGISLLNEYKLGLLFSNENVAEDYYRNIFRNITSFDRRRLIIIDDENSTLSNIAYNYTNCKYINNLTSLDDFIESFKPELNERLSNQNQNFEQIFIVFSEYNKIFSMLTDEQATFMRKVFRYINSPKYGIFFICGFDVTGNKNNDSLFMSLMVNAKNYLIFQNSYEMATSKIETLPTILNFQPNFCYFCTGEKNVVVRW